jgi:predicted molibdopterin-dependent oxidoreductase YjgC
MVGSGPERMPSHPVMGDAPATGSVSIQMDGRTIAAREGEPLVIALLAAGIRTLRTMPDSGARRGYFCGIGRCTDCLVIVDGELNVRACVTPVRAGMVVETQYGLGEWKASPS